MAKNRYNKNNQGTNEDTSIINGNEEVDTDTTTDTLDTTEVIVDNDTTPVELDDVVTEDDSEVITELPTVEYPPEDTINSDEIELPENTVTNVNAIADLANTTLDIGTTDNYVEPTLTAGVRTITDAELVSIVSNVDGLNLSVYDTIETIIVRLKGAANQADVSGVLLSLLTLAKLRCTDPIILAKADLIYEQKTLSRKFIKLMNGRESSSIVAAIRVINYTYSKLNDAAALTKDGIALINKLPSIDPMNSSLFAVGVNDEDVKTFIYLINILDIKSNAATADTSITTAKTTSTHRLSDAIVTKINEAYATIRS